MATNVKPGQKALSKKTPSRCRCGRAADSFQKPAEPPPKQGSTAPPVQPLLFDMREFSFLQGMAEREVRALTDEVSRLCDLIDDLCGKIGDWEQAMENLQKFLTDEVRTKVQEYMDDAD
jgi:hypothetical protein